MVTYLWTAVDFNIMEKQLRDFVSSSIKGFKRNVYEMILTEDLDESAVLIIYFKDGASEPFILNLLKFFRINEDRELYPSFITSAILSGHVMLEFENFKFIIDKFYNVYSAECKIRGDKIYIKQK